MQNLRKISNINNINYYKNCEICIYIYIHTHTLILQIHGTPFNEVQTKILLIQ